MKLSDFFTSVRIVMAPIFFLIYFFPVWTGTGTELSVYIIIPFFLFMEFTDFLDGYYARKLNVVSDFGKLFDPFADLIANLTVLFCFVVSGYFHPFLFLIILYRELGIMFIRMLASRKGLAIGARNGGKLKTVLYIIAAGFSLGLESIVRLGIDINNFGQILYKINIILYILAVIVSVISFIDYLIHFIAVIKGDDKKN